MFVRLKLRACSVEMACFNKECELIKCLQYVILQLNTKGQIISKWFFGFFGFLQKTNENKSTWGIIVVKSNSFVHFLEEIEDIKNPFEIIWPLAEAVERPVAEVWHFYVSYQ